MGSGLCPSTGRERAAPQGHHGRRGNLPLLCLDLPVPSGSFLTLIQVICSHQSTGWQEWRGRDLPGLPLESCCVCGFCETRRLELGLTAMMVIATHVLGALATTQRTFPDSHHCTRQLRFPWKITVTKCSFQSFGSAACASGNHCGVISARHRSGRIPGKLSSRAT